jgi:hypothetical protein
LATYKPTWILDVDGVLNPIGDRLAKYVHKEWMCHDIVDSKGKSFPVKMALPVIGFVNRVHEDELADIVWHTTWQHDVDLISEAFGLPKFPVFDAPEFESWNDRKARGWWKTPAVQRHLNSTQAATLWTDDDLNMGWDKGMRAPNGLKVIAPDQWAGLTVKQLREIFVFLTE